MEDVKKEKVKSKISVKSKNANSEQPVVQKKKEMNLEKTVVKKKEKVNLESPVVKKKKKINSENSVIQNKKEINQEKLVVKKKKEINQEKLVVKKKKEKNTEQLIVQNKKETVTQNENEQKEVVIEPINGEKQLQEINIEEIQLEIEHHNKISQEESKKIKRKIIPNIIIALILTIFYIFIELGFKNIEPQNYIVDLKVFSGILLIIAIYLFEKAYRTEDSNKSIYAIEMLIISIFNFALVYIYYAQIEKYEIIVFEFAIFTFVYYIVKSIIIYIKKKKEYFFEKSDIKQITSKQIKKKEGI